MRIRQASPEEAARLTEIAHEAKRHWGYPEYWIQHWQADLTISPDYVISNDVYVAEFEGQLIGFYALIVRESKAELEHMWVAPKHIGTGVGKELFIHAMQRVAGQHISEVEISSDPHSEGFYQKMGAIRSSQVASEIDGQPRTLPRLRIHPSRS